MFFVQFPARGCQLASLKSHRVMMRYSNKGPLCTRTASLLQRPMKSSSRKQWKNLQLNKLSRMSSHKCAKGWSFAKNFQRVLFWITLCVASCRYVARNSIPTLKISSATLWARNLGDLSTKSNQRHMDFVAIDALSSSKPGGRFKLLSKVILASMQRSMKTKRSRPFHAFTVRQGKVSECNIPAVKYPWECLRCCNLYFKKVDQNTACQLKIFTNTKQKETLVPSYSKQLALAKRLKRVENLWSWASRGPGPKKP